MKITELIYNWHQYPQGGEDWSIYTVGKGGVKEIQEHSAAGEGDKWFYDVFFDDGRMERIFNPNKITVISPSQIEAIAP